MVHIFCLIITSHVIGPNKINNNTGNMNNLPLLNSYHVPDIILNTLHILFHSILTTVHSISYFFHWFTDEETEDKYPSHTACSSGTRKWGIKMDYS